MLYSIVNMPFNRGSWQGVWPRKSLERMRLYKCRRVIRVSVKVEFCHGCDLWLLLWRIGASTMSFSMDLLEVLMPFLIRVCEGRIFFFVDLWLSGHGLVELALGLGSIRRNDLVFVCFWTKLLNPYFCCTLVFLEDYSLLSLLLTYFKNTF